VQNRRVPVLLVDTSSPKLQDLSPDRFERAELEQSLAVVAEVSLGALPALHPVRPHKLARGGVMHHQMVTDEIKLVTIQPAPRGAIEALPSSQ
jgi:hypothetical protein